MLLFNFYSYAWNCFVNKFVLKFDISHTAPLECFWSAALQNLRKVNRLEASAKGEKFMRSAESDIKSSLLTDQKVNALQLKSTTINHFEWLGQNWNQRNLFGKALYGQAADLLSNQHHLTLTCAFKCECTTRALRTILIRIQYMLRLSAEHNMGRGGWLSLQIACIAMNNHPFNIIARGLFETITISFLQKH